MVWCHHCRDNVVSRRDADVKICCSKCGRVIDEENFSSDATFIKDAAGQSQLEGNLVRTVHNDYAASREKTLNEAEKCIKNTRDALHIDGGDSIVRPALAFYTIALEKNFTRGRRKEQVVAACLYIACRAKKKPFLLIDFSEYLSINVYILGAVFLQLCKILSFEDHPIVQKPVDPSLFIHRFTARLFGGKKPNISRTALHIVAGMKRDWMQTGRKPSGVCGAALYIAALLHGLSCSKSEIIKVVHMCEATLTKRLVEFGNTESGSLTIEEFNTRAEELEKEEMLALQLYSGSKGSGITEVLCEHKKSVKLPFAHGLCQSCYADFVKLSGGLDGGSEPPAFQRAERKRLMAKEAAEENAEDTNSPMSSQVENNDEDFEPEGENSQSVTGSKTVQISQPELIGALSVAKTDHNVTPDTLHGMDGMVPDDHEETDNFLDIDDAEVDCYLYNEDEKRYVEIIWEKMNPEYLAQKLAADAVAKSRKEKQQKRVAEPKTSGPAQTPVEATKQMLTRKRLSSKINFDVLEKLFDESAIPENPKKSRKMDDLMNDNLVQSSKFDPEIDETREEAFGEDVQYDDDISYEEDFGGYDYDYGHYEYD